MGRNSKRTLLGTIALVMLFALTAYAAGTGSWDDVVTAFVDGWAKEYKLANG